MALEEAGEHIDITSMSLERPKTRVFNAFELLSSSEQEDLLKITRERLMKNTGVGLHMKSKLKDLGVNVDLNLEEKAVVNSQLNLLVSTENLNSAVELAANWSKVDHSMKLSNEYRETLLKHCLNELQAALKDPDLFLYITRASFWHNLFPGEPIPYLPPEEQWDKFYYYNQVESGLPRSVVLLAKVKVFFPTHYRQPNLNHLIPVDTENLLSLKEEGKWRDWLDIASALYILSKNEQIESEPEREIPIHRKF